MMTVCPFCHAFVAQGPWDEVEHMRDVHPDIIEQRLRAAGYTGMVPTPIGRRHGQREILDMWKWTKAQYSQRQPKIAYHLLNSRWFWWNWPAVGRAARWYGRRRDR